MSKTKMFSEVNAPLSPAVFYMLLSLGVKDRHGYDIMKCVNQDSKGKVKLGPGTLYGSIKKMLEEKLIIELEERPDSNLDDERRRYYRLTNLGRKMLSMELKRFEEALEIAKKVNLDFSLTLLKVSYV
jgi:DNA-binding PadR family transcriptional regulator